MKLIKKKKRVTPVNIRLYAMANQRTKIVIHEAIMDTMGFSLGDKVDMLVNRYGKAAIESGDTFTLRAMPNTSYNHGYIIVPLRINKRYWSDYKIIDGCIHFRLGE